MDKITPADLRIWSAALPAIMGASARPWNGRELTAYECEMALEVLWETGEPQLALEWLSEHAK